MTPGVHDTVADVGAGVATTAVGAAGASPNCKPTVFRDAFPRSAFVFAPQH